MDYPDYLMDHRHEKGDGSWWEHDAQGIALCRVCGACRDAKLSRYRPEILSGYDQSDVDEPIDFEPNPVTPEMHAEWDRVNYVQRMAEKSGDYAAIERAKAETRRVYAMMQAERAGDRYRKNPSSPPREKLQHETTRLSTRRAAERAAADIRTHHGELFEVWVEEVPSRSRPGETSYAVMLSPTKRYEPVWRSLKAPKKNRRSKPVRRKRTSRKR